MIGLSQAGHFYLGIVTKTSSPLNECVENAIACLICATGINEYIPIGKYDFATLPLVHQVCLSEHGV